MFIINMQYIITGITFTDALGNILLRSTQNSFKKIRWRNLIYEMGSNILRQPIKNNSIARNSRKRFSTYTNTIWGLEFVLWVCWVLCQ